MVKADIVNELKNNAYPGRGIIIGRSEDGENAVTAYFIMGRSSNSRNRIFVTEGEGIRTQAFDESKLEDPSLIIYAPVRVLGNNTIVTNGDQTDTIYDNLKPYLKNIVLYIQEDIHSIFGASACSNFNFGDSNGSLRAAVQVALRSANNKNCKFALVQPKIWQKNAWKKDEIIAEPYIDKTTGKPKLLSSGKVRMNTDTKQTSMNAAHRLFPETTFVMPRCRKEHDGCVDAALIALYGHKILNAVQNQG